MAKWTVVLTLWLLVPAGWPGARSPSGQARPSLSPAELPAIQDSLGGGSVVLTIDSAVLGEERVVSLATPVSFDRTRPERTYPAVIGFDGGSLMAPLLASVGALTRAGQMPEAVVVGIPNTNRIRDLTPPGLSVSGSSLAEGGDRFLDFVEHELLPALARQYRVRGPVVLVGHSSGGILATWAAATRPAFRFVLALDAPAHLGDGWLADRLIERASDEPGDLRYVSMSARFGWPAPLWERLESAAPATWSIHQAALEGETHESMTLIGGYLGLRELFADFSVVAAPAAPPGAVDAYYDDLARPYGVRLPPPERLQRQVVDDLLMAGRAADAQHALDLLAAGYGEPRDIDALRERIAEAARQPEPTETVETLLAHPFPTPADAKSWVGEWRGETWTRPEARTPMALRVRVDGARVAAEVVTWPMADQEAVQAVGHLRFDGDRIAFGYLNGMRPRGVLLYEGERSGERLAGQMRLAGMEFRMPDGRELPAVYFDLRRER